jgi:hypothetical protein
MTGKSFEDLRLICEQSPESASDCILPIKGGNGPRFSELVDAPVERLVAGNPDAGMAKPSPAPAQPKGKKRKAKKTATDGPAPELPLDAPEPIDATSGAPNGPAAPSTGNGAWLSDPIEPAELYRITTGNPRLDAALDYAVRLGWHVFPVPIGTKKSHKWEARYGTKWGMTRDPNEIREDWKAWPDANVGVPTGSVKRIWVLETDTLAGGHDHDGAAELDKLIAIHGPLPETRRGKSPSESEHYYYFAQPEDGGIKSTTSEIAPGIDTRGEGGMVIAPPSLRDGKAYRWISEAPIAEAPEWLLRLAPRVGVERPADLDHADSAAANGPETDPKLLAQMEADAGAGVEQPPSIEELKAAVAAIPNDGNTTWKRWNDVGLAIYATCRSMDAQSKGLKLSGEWLQQGFALFDAWSQNWPGYSAKDTAARWKAIHSCPPDRTGFDTLKGLAEEADPNWRSRIGGGDTGGSNSGEGIPFVITHEMRAALAANGYTPEQIRELTPRQAWDALQALGWAPSTKPSKPEGGTDPATSPSTNRHRLDEWDAGERLCGPKPRPRPWLTAKQFCRGYLSSLVARGGTGKTTVRLSQAIELAIGRSLLGWPILRRCRVLVLCLEDDEEELHRRLLAMCLHHNVDPAELKGWLFCRALQGVKLAELEGRGLKARKVTGVLYPMLEDAIAERQYELLILDPFVKLHALAENDNSDMEFVCNLLLTLARKFNIAIDTPAHTHKGATAPGDSNARRGGSAQRDADRIDFTLTVMSPDEAKRFGVPPDDRDDYVRLDSAKVNMIRAVKAQWFKLVSVRLDNADETYKDGDEVQAVERWEPTPTWAGADGKPFSSAALDAILDDIDAGMADGRLYSEYQTAKDRAAWRVVQRQCPGKPEAQCQEMIKQWVDTGVLVRRKFRNKVGGKWEQGLKLDRDARAETECDDD